jgi:hypothetical protein
VVSPEGLEPPTSDLEGRCSIQLSYGLAGGGSLERLAENGRGGGIRTHDHLVPNQVRYQAALRPDFDDCTQSFKVLACGAASINCLDTATHC